MRSVLKIGAKHMGWNLYEITVGNEREIIKVTKNEEKFSHNVTEVLENLSVKGIYVSGSEIADAIQKITTKKVPKFIY